MRSNDDLLLLFFREREEKEETLIRLSSAKLRERERRWYHFSDREIGKRAFKLRLSGYKVEQKRYNTSKVDESIKIASFSRIV